MPRKKKAEPAKAKDTETVCPNCGYCEHCGRSDAPRFVPVQPTWYPWWVQPTYAGPWWISGSATTIAGTDTVISDTISVTGVTPGAWTTCTLPAGSLTTT